MESLLARAERINELLAEGGLPPDVESVLLNRLFCICHILSFYL
jgi:hypothetical protein